MGRRPRQSNFDVRGAVRFPHSLGLFYTAFTQFLGFPKYGDEYKMMGLSAYGEPRFSAQVRDVVPDPTATRSSLNLDYFIHHTRRRRNDLGGRRAGARHGLLPQDDRGLRRARASAHASSTSGTPTWPPPCRPSSKRATSRFSTIVQRQTGLKKRLPRRRRRPELRRQRHDSSRRRLPATSTSSPPPTMPAPPSAPPSMSGTRCWTPPLATTCGTSITARTTATPRSARELDGAGVHYHAARRRTSWSTSTARADRRRQDRRLVPGTHGVRSARPRAIAASSPIRAART